MTDQLDAPAEQRELGRARTRKEDAKLVTGQTMWTDSLTMPGLL
jgi:aerobic carbon-monoxide dehydrogenase large subunit